MSIAVDPADEISYRLNLAREHLEAASKRLRVKDWPGVVQAAQLAAENAAKAVVAHVAIPSWSHDPSSELNSMVTLLPAKLRRKARQLASIAHRLAPEHGRSTYGLADRRVTPSMIYGEDDARRALREARRAVKLAEAILADLGYAL